MQEKVDKLRVTRKESVGNNDFTYEFWDLQTK